MGICLFFATGLNFAVDDYLRTSPFKPKVVLRKGEIPPADADRRPRIESSFVVEVSADDNETLKAQFLAAMKFLIKHEKELDRLPGLGVDTLHFDFGYAPPAQLRSEVYVPPDLINAMACCKMGLVFTVVRIPRG